MRKILLAILAIVLVIGGTLRVSAEEKEEATFNKNTSATTSNTTITITNSQSMTVSVKDDSNYYIAAISYTDKNHSTAVTTNYPDDGETKTVSDISVTYNNGNPLKVTITLRYILSLDEMATASSLDELTSGQAQNTRVKLNRTGISSSYWNTFCVPFDITEKEIAAVFGDGTVVKEYSGADSKDATKLKFSNASGISAGTPYLLKPTHDVASDELVFNNKTISATKPGGGTFVGTYVKKTLTTDGKQQFLGSGDYLYYPASAAQATMRGLRAYFEFPDYEIKSGEGARYSVIFDNSENVTAIDAIDNAGPSLGEPVYNLSGQQVGKTGQSLPRGIYVVGGKKTIIK